MWTKYNRIITGVMLRILFYKLVVLSWQVATCRKI